MKLDMNSRVHSFYQVLRDGKYYFLKALRPEHLSDEFYRESFRKEYDLGMHLDSEYIVRYHQLIDHDDECCLVMDFVERPTTIFYLKILGSILLFCFGAYTYYTKPAEPHKSSGKRGTLWHNAFTGFAITVSNPLIVFLFLALFARVGFIVPDHPIEQGIGYVGVLTGAIVWWLILTTALNRLGSRFDMSTISLLNRLLGLLVMVASTVGLFYTLFR